MTNVPDLILAAAPFFALAVALEALLLRHAVHEAREHAPVGYDARDTVTSMSMGLGSLAFKALVKLVMLAGFAVLFELTPLRLDPSDWWTWVIVFFADDLAFYLYHRGHHRIRLLWASHVVHHSSQHFNLSTALRQDWSPVGVPFFWAWLPLIGIPPWMVLLAMSWNLLFQFLLHTELVGKLPRPVEWVFNTPSHHRVHHGSQEQYLDKNYGGILIVWDRLLGTFEPEGERVRYGLTTNIDTHNPVKVAYGEWAAMLRDARSARTWRDRAGFLLKGPGWRPQPAASPATRAAPAPHAGGSAARSG